jgi:hypothetical protein
VFACAWCDKERMEERRGHVALGYVPLEGGTETVAEPALWECVVGGMQYGRAGATLVVANRRGSKGH